MILSINTGLTKIRPRPPFFTGVTDTMYQLRLMGFVPLSKVQKSRGLSLALLLFVYLAAACTSAGANQAKLSVMTSFYPLQEVAQRVGGDRVSAVNLTAAGGEPHDLELTPKDIERLRKSQLLVYIGGGFQPALEKAIEAVKSPNLTILDVIEGTPLMEGQAEDDGGGDQKPAEEARMDPHVWLDPTRMQTFVTKLKDALIKIDPDGRSAYEANAKAYQNTLASLDQEYRSGLKSCRKREIVTSHAAFAYLAQQYGLEQISITGINPESEPSPQHLQEVVKLTKERGVRIIFFETLVDPKVADTIAREVGAKTMVLNPIEGLTPQEQSAGKGYIDLMRQNLANLRIALECS
ncbi:MAG: zinc ABC transporter substrate-binding protein [Dehalococcoidia bacterium]|nr:zinc ABC transporter substrate-binding protein [Dehalococcoidia bacterium]